MGYPCPEGSVVIPETIAGLPVTRIGVGVRSCTNLTSVKIPNGLTIIEGWAFFGCTGLCIGG